MGLDLPALRVPREPIDGSSMAAGKGLSSSRLQKSFSELRQFGNRDFPFDGSITTHRMRVGQRGTFVSSPVEKCCFAEGWNRRRLAVHHGTDGGEACLFQNQRTCKIAGGGKSGGLWPLDSSGSGFFSFTVLTRKRQAAPVRGHSLRATDFDLLRKTNT